VSVLTKKNIIEIITNSFHFFVGQWTKKSQ
jgi:hypothetical protein